MAKIALTLPLLLAACAPVAEPAPARPETYRALGTEPFWALQIDARVMVFTEANVPGVRITQPTPKPIVGVAGEIYQSPRLRVNVVHADCSDGMSDRTYPDRVQVDVDGRRYEGCGGAPAGPTP